MTVDRSIRSIAVLGGGIVALSAAAAFRRWLPHIAVTLIPAPVAPAAIADRTEFLPPSSRRFLAWIGLDERELLRSGVATPMLGLRFEHWPGRAPAWTHVYDGDGLSSDAPALHQFWAARARAGAARPFHLYLAAGALAEAGRFLYPDPDPRSPLSTFDYGLHIHPERFHDALRRQASTLGATIESGAAASRADGHDLTLNCAGPVEAGDEDYEDWALPFEHVLHKPAPRAPGPVATILGSAGGWESDGVRVGRREGVRIRTGRLRAPWRGNMLFLGDAALGVDPLHGLGIQAAHNAILRAIDLLPGRDCADVETAEYNRRSALEAARIRDFLALHYLPWGAAPSAALGELLDGFGHRGTLVHHDEDGVARDSWIAALLGLGHVPRHINPIMAGVAPDVLDRGLVERAAGFAAIAGRSQDWHSFLASHGSAQAESTA